VGYRLTPLKLLKEHKSALKHRRRGGTGGDNRQPHMLVMGNCSVLKRKHRVPLVQKKKKKEKSRGELKKPEKDAKKQGNKDGGLLEKIPIVLFRIPHSWGRRSLKKQKRKRKDWYGRPRKKGK